MNIKDQLLGEVCSKTGLSQEQASAAFTVAVDFLKTKLPAPIASQVDAFLGGSGDADASGGLGGVMGMLGGLFGGKQ